MKRECKTLVQKAIDSLILCIGHFNSPSDRGRNAAVLIFLDHAFEMLLKAATLHRGGKIRDRGQSNTITFEECIRRGNSGGPIHFISNDQANLLRSANSLRDAEQHHFVHVSEQELYLITQAGVTVFRDILRDVFDIDLRSALPERVLPVSTLAPTDIITIFESEVEEIRRLLRPGSRRRHEAEARLRGLMIIEGAMSGNSDQPTLGKMRQMTRKIGTPSTVADLFPAVSSLETELNGTGPSLELRITKKQGLKIKLVSADTNGDDFELLGKQRVNELDFYSMNHSQLAQKVELSTSRLTAVIRHLNLKQREDCSKEFPFGKTRHRQYSPLAIKAIREALQVESIDFVWAEYRKYQKEAQSR